MTGNRIFGFSCANAAGITTLMLPFHFTLKIFTSRSHLHLKLSTKFCESLRIFGNGDMDIWIRILSSIRLYAIKTLCLSRHNAKHNEKLIIDIRGFHWPKPASLYAHLTLSTMMTFCKYCEISPWHLYYLDCITLNFSEFALLLERGPGALELLGELLGVRLQPHAAQLLLHLPHLHQEEMLVMCFPPNVFPFILRYIIITLSL